MTVTSVVVSLQISRSDACPFDFSDATVAGKNQPIVLCSSANRTCPSSFATFVPVIPKVEHWDRAESTSVSHCPIQAILGRAKCFDRGYEKVPPKKQKSGIRDTSVSPTTLNNINVFLSETICLDRCLWYY
jgi:hypothetical protein